MRTPLQVWLLLLVTTHLTWSLADVRAEETFDVLIQGGRIIDGTGAPWYVADIAILDAKIARIGRMKSAKADTVIDAEGLIVAPGFIDMMGQTATPMIDDPKSAMNLLTQGITTINAGEGQSAAPLSPEDGEQHPNDRAGEKQQEHRDADRDVGLGGVVP